jgi:2-oxoisovalerate dehydrogenase E1 component
MTRRGVLSKTHAKVLPEAVRVDRRAWLMESYIVMTKIRAFETTVQRLFAEGRLPGFVHLSIGQEAVAVGACRALQQDDWITSNHRGHGHCIAKGMSIDAMMAELFGRVSGTCRGQGGSMHIADPDWGVLGANGIVAAGLPIAAGAALAEQLRGEDRVALAFFGEGAAAQGAFHEALNLAAVWKLPMIFVCENNGYAEFSSFAETSPVSSVADRAPAYGVPATTVDGNDVENVFSACGDAVEAARAGAGPALIEAKTFRVRGHYEGDPAKYRDPKDLERALKRDPLHIAMSRLIELGTTEEEIADARGLATAEVEQAVDRAEAGDEPRLEVAVGSVYAGMAESAQGQASSEADRQIRYMDAIAEAIAEEMERDERVFALGIDIGAGGGVYGVTQPLRRFGSDRVRDAPISETALLGAAVGAALAGYRPLVEIMFMDFLGVCFDQLVNQAAKLRFMTGGKARVPLVARTQTGAGRSAGAQHSQSWEGIISHIPGLRVVMPATIQDAKGLLKAAIRSDDPIVFVENRHLYGRKGKAPPVGEVLEMGRARVAREGTDVTLVAWSRVLWEALDAAEALVDEGISVEVLDMRTIQPLDIQSVLDSVSKTSHLLVVHEAVGDFGPASEIAARVQEEGFGELDAPVMRLTPPFSPVPFAPSLETAFLPSAVAIADKIRELVNF